MPSPRSIAPLALLVYVVAMSAGCERSKPQSKVTPIQKPTPRKTTGETAMALTIQSTAFANNEPIPTRCTADGQDISPALIWSGLPEGTKELALICDDPDAPTPEPWVHWVLYKIRSTVPGLPENVAASETLSDLSGAVQGTNSWGRSGYGGPAPPAGLVHHYHFKLYALDRALNLSPGLDKKHLLSAMEGHILAQGELIGTYQR